MKRILFPALLAILILFVFSAPAHAQEATDVPAAEPTVEVTPPPVETPVPEQPTGETLVGRIAGYVAAFIAGAGTILAAGVATLPRLLSQVRNDRMMLALIEGLTNSAPKDLLDKAIMVGAAAGDLSAIIGEVTDGVPVKDKPTEIGLLG